MEHFGKYTLEEVTRVMYVDATSLGNFLQTVEEQDEVIQHPGCINTLGEVLGRADAVQMNTVLSSQILAFY